MKVVLYTSKCYNMFIKQENSFSSKELKILINRFIDFFYVLVSLLMGLWCLKLCRITNHFF